MRYFFKIPLCVAALVTLSFTSPIYSSERPAELEGVGITEHLGAQVTIDRLHFKNELGASVVLSDYFNKKKPVILMLIYLQCPHLCNLVLNGLMESLRSQDWTIGNQFDLIAVSIDPQETPELASKKKLNYLQIYRRPHAEDGWHFLTGEEAQIHALADQTGFHYKYLEKEKQYSHAAAIFILTPQGKISRYLYGTTFKSNDLRLGLLEASVEKIGSVTDRLLLFCFHFDPSKNSYTLRIWRIIQIVLCLQVLVGGILLRALWKGNRKKDLNSDSRKIQ